MPHGADSVLASVGNYNGTFKAALVPGSGAAPTIATFSIPINQGVSRAVASLAGGGWAVAGTLRPVFPQNDIVVFAMTSSNTIAWQRVFSYPQGSSLHGMVPLADGGLLLLGHHTDQWIVRLNASGGVVWQRTYADNLDVAFNSAVETATGLRLVGLADTTLGDLAVVDLDADGAVVGGRRYRPSGATFGGIGIAKMSSGGWLLAGVNSATNKYAVVETGAGLEVTCSDTAIGTTLPNAIPSNPATFTVTNSNYTVTTTTATTTPITLSVTPQVPTRTGICN